MRKLLLIPLLALALAGCNLGVPPPEESDWCYTFFFPGEPYEVNIINGEYVEGWGYATDDSGLLSVNYSQTNLVKAAGITVLVTRDQESVGDIDIYANGIIFGIGATLEETLPSDINEAAVGFAPVSADETGTTFNITLTATQKVYLKAIRVYGNYDNPFGINECGDEPPETPEATPTETFTPSPTPSYTPTPTDTPQGMDWTYSCDFRVTPGNWATTWYYLGAWEYGSGWKATVGGLHRTGTEKAISTGATLRSARLWFAPASGSTGAGISQGSGETWSALHNDNTGFASDSIGVYIGKSWTPETAPTLSGPNIRLYANTTYGSPIAIRFIYLAGNGENPFGTNNCLNDLTPTPTATITRTPNPSLTPRLTATASWTPIAFTPPPVTVTLTPSLTPIPSLTPVPTFTRTPIPRPTWIPTSTPINGEDNEDAGEVNILNGLNDLSNWLENTSQNFADWLQGMSDSMVAYLNNASTNISNSLSLLGQWLNTAYQIAVDIWEILKLVISIIWHLLVLLMNYVGQVAESITAIFNAWFSTSAAPIPFLPRCVTAPMDMQICALYYVLQYTLFGGGIGTLIIPVLTIVIDLAIILLFVRQVRNLLQKGQRAT